MHVLVFTRKIRHFKSINVKKCRKIALLLTFISIASFSAVCGWGCGWGCGIYFINFFKREWFTEEFCKFATRI